MKKDLPLIVLHINLELDKPNTLLILTMKYTLMVLNYKLQKNKKHYHINRKKELKWKKD